MRMSNAEYHAKEDISASDLKSWIKTCPKVWHQLKYGDGKVDHAPVVKKAFRDGELAHAFTLERERAEKHYIICPNKFVVIYSFFIIKQKRSVIQMGYYCFKVD